MSRLINQPVQMTMVPGDAAIGFGPAPSTFIWRGARYRVLELLESWEEIGRWWEKEPSATAWRVRVQHGGVMELVRLHAQPPEWRLMRVFD
jgi:hypothetical protein